MTSIDGYFDKVFYINISHDIHRNASMLNQFQKMGITNYERVEGCLVDELPEKQEYRNFNKLEKKYVLGSLGCRESHLSIVRLAKERNYEKVLIFEDDVVMTQNLNTLLNANEAIFNDWDVLYFGGLIEHFFRNQIVCLHAYAIRKSVFDDVLNMCNPSGMEVDNFYAKVLQHMSYNYNQSGKYNIRTIQPFNTIIQNQNYDSNIKD